MELKDLNSQEFKGYPNRIPTCQFLLTNGTAAKTGFENNTSVLFIKEQSLRLSVFKKESEGIPYTHTFRNAEKTTEKGLAFTSPRIIFLKKSPRFIEVTESGESKNVGIRGQIIGNFDQEQGAYLRSTLPQGSTTLRTIYMVLLVDKNGEFLHKVPLSLSIKGVSAVFLGQALEDYYQELSEAYTNSKYGDGSWYVMNKKAKALAIANINLETKEAGREQVALVPGIESIESPSSQEIDKYFVKNLDLVLGMLPSLEGFDKKYFDAFREYHPEGATVVEETVKERALQLVPDYKIDDIPF